MNQQWLLYNEQRGKEVEAVRTEKESLMAEQSRRHAETIAHLNGDISQLRNALHESEASAKAKEQPLEQLEAALRVKDSELESRQQSIEERDQTIQDQKDRITRNDIFIAQQRRDIVEKSNAIDDHGFELDEMEKQYKNQLKTKQEKADSEITALKTGNQAAMDRVVERANEIISQEHMKHEGIVIKLEESLENERRSAAENLSRKEADDSTAVQRLRDDHATSVRQLRSDITDAKRQDKEEADRKTEEHDHQIRALREDHARTEGQVQFKLDEMNRLTKEAMEKKVEQHKEQFQDLKSNHESEITSLSEANHAAVKKHKLDTARIHQYRQEANAAKLNRDDNETYIATVFHISGLPRKTDDQIRDGFAEIQELVENLGRLTWKKVQPQWTSDLLRRAGSDKVPREVKRAIVQDAIWTTLFEFVFSSPFRIFGDAGRLLEQQWTEHCGEGTYRSQTRVPLQDVSSDSLKGELSTGGDYKWPTTSVRIERWRYFSLKGAREALIEKVSNYDQRMGLKRSFKASQDGLTTELQEMLDEVVEMSSSDMEKVQKLAKQVFPLWLDYSMHRCRIVVFLKGREEQSANRRESSSILTIQPLIGRYGNVTGSSLEIFKIIDECAGDAMSIS